MHVSACGVLLHHHVMSPEIEPLLIGDGAAAGPGDGGEVVGDGAVSGDGAILWSHGEGAFAPPLKSPSCTAEENGRRRNDAERQMWKMPLSIFFKFLGISLYGELRIML